MLCSRVAFSYSMADIMIMKSICEDAGVEVFDLQLSGQVSLAGADTGFYLDVPESAADEARAVLRKTDYEKFIIVD